MIQQKFDKKMKLSRKSSLTCLSLLVGTLKLSPTLQAESTKSKALLGLDGHSLRGMKWKASKLIDYAISKNLNAVLFNGFQYLESTDKSHLLKLKEKADQANIKIYIGAGAISQSAPSFKGRDGTPTEALRKGIDVAKLLGSPVINCRIGNIMDRNVDGGIDRLLDEAAKNLLMVKQEAKDEGLKFAFENHAGDTRSEEILNLISTVGRDTCGVMLDPGNALWSLEDPMLHLEKLVDHVECMSLRDYMVWESAEGAMFQWTAIGEGLMNVASYVGLLQKKRPNVPLFVETISNSQRPIPYLTKDFWKGFQNLKASETIDFQKLVKRGKPLPVLSPANGQNKKSFEQEHQMAEFEKSIQTLRKVLNQI